MSAAQSPPSPERSNRNAESEESKAFYDKQSPNSAFGEGAFWGMSAPGIIEDDEEDIAVSNADGGFIGENVPVEAEFRDAVIASVKFARKDGKDWHVSNVNSATTNASGGIDLALVLCSGDLCTQKKFAVSADGVVSAVGGGMF